MSMILKSSSNVLRIRQKLNNILAALSLNELSISQTTTCNYGSTTNTLSISNSSGSWLYNSITSNQLIINQETSFAGSEFNAATTNTLSIANSTSQSFEGSTDNTLTISNSSDYSHGSNNTLMISQSSICENTVGSKNQLSINNSTNFNGTIFNRSTVNAHRVRSSSAYWIENREVENSYSPFIVEGNNDFIPPMETL